LIDFLCPKSILVPINFDSINLNAQIKSINITDKSWAQIYLLCNSGSDNIEATSKGYIQLPWFEFRRIIKSLAKYIKKEHIKVQYDTYSKDLIFTHLDDSSSLKKTMNGEISEIINVEKELLTTTLKRNLTNEQLRDLSKLIAIKHGANFSVPGAGKTSTLLGVHAIKKRKNIVSKLLVIAPRNAFISWEDEIIACFEGSAPRVTRLSGGRERISKLLNENPEINLITYHQLPSVVEEIIQFLRRNKVHLVLDESHRIKRGMPGIHYSAVIKLADFSPRRDILSGTPLPQSISDLEPQFDFLWPGGDILIDLLKSSEDAEIKDSIKNYIKPLYVRTTKKELGLKPPEIKITTIKLGAVQSELYELLRSEAARVLSCMDKRDMISFRKFGRQVIRLLQMASNPMLITSDNSYEDEIFSVTSDISKLDLLTEFSKYEKPAKIEYALNRVKELINEGRKVVVWSAFVKNIELLETFLSDFGAVSIHGSIETGDETEIDTREWRIRRFHEDQGCKVLIANPAACGEGISLHKVCHYALYLDRTFNAAHFLQSVDRIHRLGLPSSTITEVEILLADDTIDFVVDSRLKDKIQAMGEVLDDSDLRALAYDPEDIIEELPGGIDNTDLFELHRHIGG